MSRPGPKPFDPETASSEQRMQLLAIEAARTAYQKAEENLLKATARGRDLDIPMDYLPHVSGMSRATLFRRLPVDADDATTGMDR